MSLRLRLVMLRVRPRSVYYAVSARTHQYVNKSITEYMSRTVTRTAPKMAACLQLLLYVLS